MKKSSKTSENKHLVPPPRKAVTSRRRGFWGATHGIILDDYRLNFPCHCEGAADFGKADRTNVRERRPHEQSYVVKFLRSKNETKFKLCELPIIQEAHSIIVDDYRLNFPCHCEDSERNEEDEAISLNKVDLMPRDCHAAPSAPLAMTCNGKRKAAFTQSCHPDFAKGTAEPKAMCVTLRPSAKPLGVSGSKNKMLKQVQHDMSVSRRKKAAFTLAETLITLMVIGVVAALTIPALMQQIGDYTLKGQRKTTASKIKEGFARMRVNGALETKYASTAEFVEAMKKYFQISTVCDSNNLTKCFIETVVTTNEGELTENKINEMKDKDKVMGVRFSDGTSMLIKYNTEAGGVSEGYSEAEDKKDAESITTYGGLFEYVYDVNNQKSPNTRGKDIIGNLVLDKGGDPYGLGFEIINNTVYSPDTCVGDVCYNSSGTYYDKDNSEYVADWYQGAVDFCKDLGGSLPNNVQLEAIAAKIYPCEGCSADTTSELWSLVGNSSMWSSVPDGDDRAYLLSLNEDSFFIDPFSRRYGMTILCIK